MADAFAGVSIAFIILLAMNGFLILSAFGEPYPPSPIDGGDGKIRAVLKAGDLAIFKDEEGYDLLMMEGFAATTSPGDPMLVHRVYNLLVPPGAVLEDLRMEMVSAEVLVLEGTYEIRPVGPLVPAADDFIGVPWVEFWGEDKEIVDGKNLAVYGKDLDYPERAAELLPGSEMRKWRFTRVDFTPVQYNPVSKKLTLIKSCIVEISYQTSPEPLDLRLLSDAVMDGFAPVFFDNYDQGKGWYEDEPLVPSPEATCEYVIITTNAIVAGSGKLDDFIAHKESLGYGVLVVTEDDFLPLTGQAPNNRAEKIRQWLKNNYISKGIKYVLLIGDPTPYESGEGDIPMKMCWPRYHETTYTDYRDAPTDYFYADLTGNWDKNGDGIYGQWGVDYPVSGGVDFTPEVYVGRIPVYAADYASLDSILQKIISYELSPSTDWRRSVLFPMSFSDSKTDGARLSEQMRSDYLNSRGYTSWRMYQQGSGPCGLNSVYPSEEELRGGTGVRDRWAAGDYGVILWWAHGSKTQAGVGYSGCKDGILFDSSYTTSLDDARPSFTFQCSCLNACPETVNNLAYALLRQGGISTISATRVSWYLPGETQFKGRSTNSGMAYEYAERLTRDLPGGDALYQMKQTIYPSESALLMNWYVMNLYGDPSVSLKNPPPPPEPPEPPEISSNKRIGRWQRPV